MAERGAVEDVNLELPLHAEERGQQADGTATETSMRRGAQDAVWAPAVGGSGGSSGR